MDFNKPLDKSKNILNIRKIENASKNTAGISLNLNNFIKLIK